MTPAEQIAWLRALAVDVDTMPSERQAILAVCDLAERALDLEALMAEMKPEGWEREAERLKRIVDNYEKVIEFAIARWPPSGR